MSKQETFIWITAPSKLRTLRPKIPPGLPWCYLGTKPAGRQRAERLLGAAHRHDLADALRPIAENLRQPFLDLVAEVGRLQADPIVWWSTRFSWKMWAATDFFLLVCYLGFSHERVRHNLAHHAREILVVENPWLLRQLKENLRSRTGVRVEGGSSLIRERVQAVGLGLAKRIVWLFRTAKHHWRQQRVWPNTIPPVPSQAAAAICSTPLISSLRSDGGWEDHHLPGLASMLKGEGIPVFRFSSPEFSGLEQALAERASYFRPLILYASWPRVWRSLKAFWKPRWPTRLSVAGLEVRWLCFQEGWLEISRASLCGFRMFYECLREMLSRGNWGWIITSYENQPWEKLIALCARERGIRLIGVQTAILSRDYLPYLLGKGEAERMPLPDIIATSGPYGTEVLERGGTPSDRLHFCGAIRYPHLNPETAKPLRLPLEEAAPGAPALRPPPAGTFEVLVVLPIHLPMAEHLLMALKTAFPDGGKRDRLRFQIRPHPMFPKLPKRIGFSAELTSTSFSSLTQALRGCDLLLFTGSTVGFEALALGQAALRYRSPLLLDVDEEVYGDRIPVCSDSSLRDRLLSLIRSKAGDSPTPRPKAVGHLFAPFDPEKLLTHFRQPALASARAFGVPNEPVPERSTVVK